MGSGFSNPLVGGGGALVFPSIHSPNYVLNVTGWAIRKDGTAQFTGIVLIGGTFTGTNFVINSSGAFFYSGAPALGNLSASIASAAGTDSHGNNYQAGVSVYQYSGGNLAIIAQLLNGGMQVGTPAQFAGTGGAAPGTVTGLLFQPNTLELLSPVASSSDVLAGLELQSKNDSGVGVPLTLSSQPIGMVGGTTPTKLASSGLLFADVNGRVGTVNPSGRASTLVGSSNVSVGTTTVTAAALTDIASATIPAGDAVAGSVYELEAFGNGVLGSTVQNLVFVAAIAGNPIGSPQGPAAGAWNGVASAAFRWHARARIVVRTAGVGGTLVGNVEGCCSVVAGPNLIPGNTTDFTIPFSAGDSNTDAIDTTAANVFSIQCKWGSTTGASTISAIGAYLKRVA